MGAVSVYRTQRAKNGTRFTVWFGLFTNIRRHRELPRGVAPLSARYKCAVKLLNYDSIEPQKRIGRFPASYQEAILPLNYKGLEPTIRFERITSRLRSDCTTSCATKAIF